MFKTVLLALDGSKESHAAVPFARDLVADDGTIQIIHVREILAGRGGGRPLNVQQDEVEEALLRTAHYLAESGVEVKLTIPGAVAGGVAPILADAARTVEADVIVLSTHGHRALVGMLLGSVTPRLLGLAPCPVLVVPRAAIHFGASSAPGRRAA